MKATQGAAGRAGGRRELRAGRGAAGLCGGPGVGLYPSWTARVRRPLARPAAAPDR